MKSSCLLMYDRANDLVLQMCCGTLPSGVV